MREFKILAIVLFFTAVTYWGVEPYAHSQMHPHVAPADFGFKDIEPLHVNGNVESGKALVEANCIACHSIKSLGLEAPMSFEAAASAYGVVPPDLSHAGVIYDKNYLAGFLKDPVSATKLSHKFGDTKPYAMPSFNYLSEQEIADIVAYLGNIVSTKASNKMVFEEACGRCHSMKYDGFKAQTPASSLKSYLGAEAPDVSMMIRSKKAEYLSTFINEPLKMVEGIAMPRVGLTEASQEQVVAYMESVGDRKKAERESLGLKLIGFMAIFTLIAYLWKVQIWKEVE
ncbi:c-type cytochrome [Sulfurospirillum diekertiae]|uniref:Ubiquinol cytochrome C oxidoreductase, cytochrome C1 subunit n=1 Tax=Sulfurospirillum diekertiae TaxID=1854492 RepID=A0A1Y0HJD7_9BACT|nr:c-type cytochrome [Sulfurospirillum diekertiae]ARU48070.1 ubiquinol cytochrome C oxidoreductase, cytochrome C1 subunit [Sulfurospirillum diekertiae]ASC92916.1 ubiquinol cytochrome C oxidoreductase, cytochrome C1 subunit [Sulfurospirillum diekertiae]